MRSYITAGLCLALAGAATVTGQVREGSIKREAAKVTGRRVSEILGTTVTQRGGEALGKVSDLVLGSDGRVEYYIVRQGDDLVAVPWGAIDRADGDLRVTTAIARDRLKGVLFREASWPDFASAGWRERAGLIWGASTLPRLASDRLPPPPRATETARPTNSDPRSRSDPLLPGGTGDTRDRKPVKD